MHLYHGGTEVIEKPEVRIANRPVDFGDGFYTKRLKMDERELSTLIWLRVRDIVKMLLEQNSIPINEAFNLIYNSQVFELLSNEKTKVWHYSVNMLYYLLQNEIKTGKVELPEFQF